MKIRKTATYNICAITASSLKKLNKFFFREFVFARDERRFDDVYILDGSSDRGRDLRLVFQDKGNGLVRVFTGWDFKGEKKNKR